MAVSEQHGSPRVEGDPLQVGVHEGDGQPALLLLQVNTVHSTVQYTQRLRRESKLKISVGG